MCTVCLSKRNKHETEAYGIVFIGQQIQSIDFMFAQPNWRAAVSLRLPILCTYLCTGYMSNEHKHCIHGVLFCLWFYKIYIRNFKVRHFVAEYVPHLHYPFCHRIPIPYATIEMWAFFCTFVYWMNLFFLCRKIGSILPLYIFNGAYKIHRNSNSIASCEFWINLEIEKRKQKT